MTFVLNSKAESPWQVKLLLVFDVHGMKKKPPFHLYVSTFTADAPRL